MHRAARSREAGFYAVLAAIVLPLVLAAFGLAIDAGRLRWAHGQLRNAADAAAFAGSKDLNGTGAGRTRAVSSAKLYAQQYKVDGTVVAPEEIVENVTGHWDFLSKSFTPTDVSDPAANAIRVSVVRRNVSTLIGSMFPKMSASTDLAASAIAVAGGTGSVSCAAPFTIAACVLQYDSDGTMKCPTSLSFQNGLYSIGLTVPDGSSPVSGNRAHPFFIDMVNDPTGCGHRADVGDVLYQQDGSDLAQSSVNAINSATSDGAKPIPVSVAVVNTPCSDTGPSYNQAADVTGFIRMNLVGGRWTGDAPKAVADACPNLTKKSICITANCTPIDAPSGGTANVHAENVFLVH